MEPAQKLNASSGASQGSSAIPSSVSNGDISSLGRPAGTGKRSRRNDRTDDSAIDDILLQITSKLTALTTEATESDRQEESVKAFLEVLGGSREEASFYLESSNWDIATAVYIWLDNNPTRFSQPTISLPSAPTTNLGYKYKDLVVQIAGLPGNWQARVSRSTGQIYFKNLVSDLTQFAVPPGFADAAPAGSAAAATDFHGTISHSQWGDSGKMRCRGSGIIKEEEDIDAMSTVAVTHELPTSFLPAPVLNATDSEWSSYLTKGVLQSGIATGSIASTRSSIASHPGCSSTEWSGLDTSGDALPPLAAGEDLSPTTQSATSIGAAPGRNDAPPAEVEGTFGYYDDLDDP